MPEYVLDRSRAPETWAALTAFERGYIEAAMWTLTDEDSEPCDHLGLHDIAPATIKAACEDCSAFTSEVGTRALLDSTGADDEQHGHDFWVTRNSHGCGFWSHDYGVVGDELTNRAHTYGEADWYVGDDGLVYQLGAEPLD